MIHGWGGPDHRLMEGVHRARFSSEKILHGNEYILICPEWEKQKECHGLPAPMRCWI
jgi:hypothetical protein